MRVLLAAVIAMLPAAAPAQILNEERGRALYENHCVICHTPYVHKRINRIAFTRAEVRELVENWQKQQALRWDGQDIDDVVEFLSRTQYQIR